MNSPFQNMIKGAVAGLLATFPMTLFMLATWRRLPAREQYPLPPRQITSRLVHEVDPTMPLDQDQNQLTVLTLLLHFLFGGVTGGLYGVLEDRLPLRASAKGTLMGMAVWSGSYLGWIPLLGILSPATRHPWRRNALMIVAHVIWGMTLGTLTRLLKGRRASSIPLE